MSSSILLLSVPLLLLVSLVSALPAYPGRLPNGRASETPGSGLTCLFLGHNDCVPGAPRNQFGLDFAAEGHQWTTALCQKDSDDDGLTNGQELGDPCCEWEPGNDSVLRTDMLSHPGDASSMNKAPPKTCPDSPGEPSPVPATPSASMSKTPEPMPSTALPSMAASPSPLGSTLPSMTPMVPSSSPMMSTNPAPATKCASGFLRWRQPVCLGNSAVKKLYNRNGIVAVRAAVRVQYMRFRVTFTLTTMNNRTAHDMRVIRAVNVRIGGKGNFTNVRHPRPVVSVLHPHRITGLDIPAGKTHCCAPHATFPFNATVRYFNLKRRRLGKVFINGVVGVPCRPVCNFDDTRAGVVVPMSDNVQCTFCKRHETSSPTPSVPSMMMDRAIDATDIVGMDTDEDSGDGEVQGAGDFEDDDDDNDDDNDDEEEIEMQPMMEQLERTDDNDVDDDANNSKIIDARKRDDEMTEVHDDY